MGVKSFSLGTAEKFKSLCEPWFQNMYAFTITPMSKLGWIELIKQPPDATECPFTPLEIKALHKKQVHSLFRSCLRCGKCQRVFSDTACSGNAWRSGDVQMFPDLCTHTACVVWML